ncbi:MAG: NUDIX hydrolase [Alphaproteobacteria bacterium]
MAAAPAAARPRPQLAASAAVFRDGKLLIACRAAGPGAGNWSLPGGRVEAGETLAEAAAREVMEEVGVAAEIVAVAGIREIIRRDAAGTPIAHFVVVAHAARWRAGEPTTGPEASAVAWVDPYDLGDRPTTDGLAEIVRAASRLIDP